MTTATHTEPGRSAAAQPAGPAIPMTRLVEVELRKMVDTRAGRWLLIGIAGLIALVLGIIVISADDPGTKSFENLSRVAQLPIGLLLPVLGVLAATSEWNQRTVLGTFSLVPRRGRSLQAKIIASLVLATAAVIVSMVFAALLSVIGSAFTSVDQNWNLGLSNAGEILVYQWLSMLLGVALGTLFLSSGLAIVLYFALPTIWSGITDAFSSLHDLQLWADTGTTWLRLLGDDPMDGLWWQRVATTGLAWIALPLAIGTWRVLRREVD